MSEVWRPIDRAPDYEVSNLGRVRRVTPYRSTQVGRVLRQHPHRNGHIQVKLGVGGKTKGFYVHVLVCEAFHGPAPSPQHIAAHWDGIPSHNHDTNIRWATHVENMADRKRHGTDPVGERNPNKRLTDLQIRLIRAHYAFGESKAVLARLFEVSDVHIGRIVTGKMRREAGGYL